MNLAWAHTHGVGVARNLTRAAELLHNAGGLSITKIRPTLNLLVLFGAHVCAWVCMCAHVCARMSGTSDLCSSVLVLNAIPCEAPGAR